MPVRIARQLIDAREFAEELAAYEVEPWGDERDDRRMGALIAEWYNLQRSSGSQEASHEAFMHYLNKQAKTIRKQSEEEMMAILGSAFGIPVAAKQKA